MSQQRAIYVTEFNKSRLVVEKPSSTKADNIVSNIKYRYEDTQAAQNLYLTKPIQTSFGLQYKYRYKDNNRSYPPIGFQLIYNVTSLETKDNPTPDEKASLEVWNKIRDVVAATMKKHRDLLPDSVATRFENEGVDAIKTPLVPPTKQDPAFPNNKKKRIPDPEKTYKIYLDVMISDYIDQSDKKTGVDIETAQFITQFYIDDNLIHPREIFGTSGNLKVGKIYPVLWVKRVFYNNANGRTSIQCVLWMAHYHLYNTRPQKIVNAPNFGKMNEEELESIRLDDEDNHQEDGSDEIQGDIENGTTEEAISVPKKKVNRKKKKKPAVTLDE